MKTLHDFFLLVFMVFPVIVAVAFYRDSRKPKQKLYSYHISYLFNSVGYGMMTLTRSVEIDSVEQLQSCLDYMKPLIEEDIKHPVKTLVIINFNLLSVK